MPVPDFTSFLSKVRFLFFIFGLWPVAYSVTNTSYLCTSQEHKPLKYIGTL